MDDINIGGVRLGPYELLEELGEGGMGRVWRARHASSGREVALKAITSSRASTPLYRRAFRREVEAVARVAHPYVTTIYDFGEASVDDAVDSNGAFGRGAPWLAMEVCNSGSMSDPSNRPTSATELRNTLCQVLEALAFAHARGVLHRDLKPENILVQDVAGRRRQIRLADFGISHAFSQSGLAESTAQISAARAGTPQYMAPEQIVADWRNWGWWTDLYALGVIAYEWASGAPPFRAENWVQVSQMHLSMPPPPLKPLFPLPEAFHRWIHRLLAKAPFERYERAADALHALQQIEIVDELTTTDELPAEVWANAPTQLFETATKTEVDSEGLIATFEALPTFISATTLTRGDASPHKGSGQGSGNFGSNTPHDSGLNYAEPRAADRAFHSSYAFVPPMPTTWEPTSTFDARDHVLARGVSLFGLREVPLIGRHDERNLLWETLQQVRRDARPAVTFIRGETGLGKSALARWFTQRADETGSGFIIQASHDTEESIAAGLRRMLMRLIRGEGLSHKELYERLKFIHSIFTDGRNRDYDVAALTELLSPGESHRNDPDVPRFRFPTLESRFETGMLLVKHLARVRPIVIWLDDAHWSSESLQFAHHIMERAPTSTSIHLVITIRSDLIAERHRAQLHMEKLIKHERTRVIDLQPMPFPEMQALVESMVRVAPDLRDELSLRAAGRPVHAVQLLGHLVEQRALVEREEVYELVEGQALPTNIQDLWIARVEDAMALSDAPTAAIQAITLAALIGMRIDEEIWIQVCKRTGVGGAQKVLELFTTAGLVERTGDAWRLSHDLLRYALTRRATELDEWSMYQWMCADIIRVVLPESTSQLLRIAKHYYRGGYYDETLEICLGPLSQVMIDSRADLLREAAKIAEEALNRLTDGNPKSDSRWGAVRANVLAEAPLFRAGNDPALQKQATDELLQWAAAAGDLQVAADAHRIQADAHLRRGEHLEGKDHITRLVDLAERSDSPLRLGRGYTMFAAYYAEQHHPEKALDYADRAVAIFREHDQPMRLAWALLSRSRALMQLERFELARDMASEASAIFNDEGSFPGVAFCKLILSQVYRYWGRLARAETAVRRALDINAWAGLGQHQTAILALAAVLVERSRYDEALEIYHDTIDELRAKDMHHHVAHLALSAAVAFAGKGDGDSFDEALEESWSFWAGGHFDNDVPRFLSLASTLWEGRADRIRAREARRLAAHYDSMVHHKRTQI